MAKYMIHGVELDSKLEVERFLILREQEQRGEISDLVAHPSEFVLQEAFTDAWGTRHRKIGYRPDFLYTLPDGTRVAEETKPAGARAISNQRRDWRLRQKLAAARYPDLRWITWRPPSRLACRGC